MDAASMRRRALWADLGKLDSGAVATWLFAFAVVAYLGLKGGGYDSLVHDRIGIAVWWILLLAVVVGALPRGNPGVFGWSALALLGGFAIWTALSLIWTESVDRTSADLARLAGYVGVFAFALLAYRRGSARLAVGAVATAIVLVSAVALLSRLHPTWFPQADQTARFIADSRERLSYPLNYWNGLAALVAIGMPLLLHCACEARSLALRGLATAALPAMALTAFLTLSRGGIAAAAIALALFLLLAPDRLPKLLALLVAGAGAGVLIAAASARQAFQQGLLTPTAESQGDTMLAIILLVCVIVGLVQAAISYGLRQGLRPAWTVVPPTWALRGAIAAVLVVLIAALALDAPDSGLDAWDEFKGGGGPGGGAGRLTSVAGESRYALWSAAWDEAGAKPLGGTGSGTFEFWWNRTGGEEVVRDAHSLYLQTVGELGFVGLALLGAFFLLVLVGGGRAIVTATATRRSALAAALAGCAAFYVTAGVDWMWQIPVLPISMLLLAVVLVAEAGSAVAERLEFGPLQRLVVTAVSLAAVVAIAVPLAATALVRDSEADVRAGDLAGALEQARSAQNVQSGAAAPRLQEALVLEQSGDLGLAAPAALAATEREATNWRNWLVLARIEAERGRPEAAVRAFERARRLNPNHSLFAR